MELGTQKARPPHAAGLFYFR